jgi:hypothetical protein
MMDVVQWILDVAREGEAVAKARELEAEALRDLQREARLAPIFMLNIERRQQHRSGTFEDKWLHFARIGLRFGPTGDYGLNSFCWAQFWGL